MEKLKISNPLKRGFLIVRSEDIRFQFGLMNLFKDALLRNRKTNKKCPHKRAFPFNTGGSGRI